LQISLKRTAGWVAICIVAVLGLAQEPKFRARSNVVTVPTLVKDEKGGAVYGLEARDFQVDDDGFTQTVRLDETVESEPVSLVVVLQVGRRANREFPRMRGLGSMLSPVFSQPGCQVALVEFDSDVELVRDFTSSSALIEGDLERLRPGNGGAAILDALQFSVRLLENVPNPRRRVLLLISETRDHGSHIAKIQDVVTGVGNSSTVVYALPFSPSLSQVLDTERGSNKDEWGGSPNLIAPLMMVSQAMRKNTANAVATMTGGEYEMFESRRSFERLMVEFTNHLQSRYLLSFEPQSPHPGLHEIRVRLRDPGKNKNKVLARTSYWAEGTSQ
jgi:VWFA-related protein